jgi:hypothetical protein
MSNRPKLVLALDYDGTLVTGDWPNVGRLNRNAKKFYKWAISRGHKLILWTCRDRFDLVAAVKYLQSEGLDFDLINENEPELIKCFENDPRKLGCDWYFDDKAGFINWELAFLTVLWLEYKMRRC